MKETDKYYTKEMGKVWRAGVIPYIINEDNEIEMMFMRPSETEHGGNKYQLAKGKLEEGETPEEGGIREAKEELGLFVGNIEDLYQVDVFLGRTYVYNAKVKDKDMFGLPHHETESTKWLTLEQFMIEGRDLHKPVIQAAHRAMVKKEEIEVK